MMPADIRRNSFERTSNHNARRKILFSDLGLQTEFRPKNFRTTFANIVIELRVFRFSFFLFKKFVSLP